MVFAQPPSNDQSPQLPTTTTEYPPPAESEWSPEITPSVEILVSACWTALVVWSIWIPAWYAGLADRGCLLRLGGLLAEYIHRGRLVGGIGPILDDIDRWHKHDDPHPPPILSRHAMKETALYFTILLPLILPGPSFRAFEALLLPLLPGFVFYFVLATLAPRWTSGFAKWVVAEHLITIQPGLIAAGLAIWGYWQSIDLFNAFLVILYTSVWPHVGEITKLYIRMGIGLLLSVIYLPTWPIWLFRQNLKVPYWYIKRQIRARSHASLQEHTVRDGEEYYVYNELSPGYIRVLDIYRRQLTDKISGGELQCRLRTVKLSKPGKFDAISYTWGDSKPNKHIRIGEKMMLVRLNAYNLLQDRASVEETRTIWIDCICINQADTREKSYQVTLMDMIYRRAVRTIIWLGSTEEYPDAELVLSLVGDLVERPLPNIESCPKLLQRWIQSRGARFQRFEGLDPRFPVLARLLEHNYFFRVWITQEVVFSNKIHIRCGGCWIDWEIFSKALISMGDPAIHQLVGGETLLGYVNEPCALGQIIMLSHYRVLERLAVSSSNPRPKLCHRLGDIWMANSTDARDMVFGLLNLTQEAKNPDFAPDYNRLKDPKEFFTDIAQRFRARGELSEILYYAGIGYPSLGEDLPSRVSRTPIENLPSWVPDWTCQPLLPPLRRKNTGLYKTSKDTKAEIRLISQSSIALPGIHIDQILSVTSAVFPGVDLSNTKRQDRFWNVCFQEIAAKRLVADLDDVYLNKQPKMKAFWRTLICDTDIIAQSKEFTSLLTRLNITAANHLPRFETPASDESIDIFDIWDKCLVAIEESGLDLISCQKPLPRKGTPKAKYEARLELGRKLVELYSDSGNQQSIERLDYLGQINRGRKFAITKTGYMAIVPPGTMRGDDVYVFDGLDVPFVTRQCKGGSEASQLVGECYVHGVMDGEKYHDGSRKVEVTLV